MPILSPEQKATLAARLAEPDCADLDDDAATAVLNVQPTIPNPAPAPSAYRPLDPLGLLVLLSPESETKLEGAGLVGPLEEAVRAQDRARLGNWVAYARARGHVSQAEADAVRAAIAASDPDPSWPATVVEPSWANTWAPGVEFTIPAHEGQAGDHSVADHVTVEMVREARA